MFTFHGCYKTISMQHEPQMSRLMTSFLRLVAIFMENLTRKQEVH